MAEVRTYSDSALSAATRHLVLRFLQVQLQTVVSGLATAYNGYQYVLGNWWAACRRYELCMRK